MTSTARSADPVKSRTCCVLRRNTTGPGVISTRGFAALSLVDRFFAARFATLEPLRLVFAFFFMADGYLLLPDRAIPIKTTTDQI